MLLSLLLELMLLLTKSVPVGGISRSVQGV
jgi:hypothetical protein